MGGANPCIVPAEASARFPACSKIFLTGAGLVNSGVIPVHVSVSSVPHVFSISSKETMNLLSLFRLGIDMGIFQGSRSSLTEELFIITQPAHLEKSQTSKLSAEKRDILRANLLRDRLRKINRPETPNEDTQKNS